MPRSAPLRMCGVDRRQRQHQRVDVIAERRGDRRRAALERHVDVFHLGDLLEEILRADLRAGAGAGAAVGEALLLGVGDELLQVLGRIARMDGDHVGADGDEGDRAQVALLEAPVLRGGHVGGKARGRRQQRVAVRRGAGHRLGRDVAAGAAAVLDHEAVLEAVFELGRNQPRDHVGEPAGREGDDHGDVLRRIGLRERGLRQTRQPRSRQQSARGISTWYSPSSSCRTLVRANRERQCDALAVAAGHRRPQHLLDPRGAGRSITSRSKPSAMPLAGGIAASAARKSSSIGYCSP